MVAARALSLSSTSQLEMDVLLLQLRKGHADGHPCDGRKVEAIRRAELHCPRRVKDYGSCSIVGLGVAPGSAGVPGCCPGWSSLMSPQDPAGMTVLPGAATGC